MQTEGRESSSGSRRIIDSNPNPWKTAHRKEIPELSARQISPLRLLAIIIGGVFLAEVIAMIVVYTLRPGPYIWLTLIDAGIMTILIFPLLYFLSFRPLLRYIQISQQGEKKNRMLSRIVEQTADTVVVTGRDGVIEYVNPAFEQVTGYGAEVTLGKTPRVLKSGIHEGQFYKELWDTILSGEVFQSEIANLKRNGELFYEVKTITPLRDESGDITHFVATGKDITERKQADEQLRKAYDQLELRVQERTEELRYANSVLEEEIIERKQAEEAIKESEEKYRSLFDNMSEGFGLHEIILDADGAPCDYRFLELNAAFEELTGLSREKILGRTIQEVLPDIEPHWVETYGRVALSGEPVHFIEYSASLGRWYETYCYSPRQNQFAVVFFDVTERVRVEEALRESETRYKSLVENAPIGIYEINLVDRKLTSVNDVLCNETGYSREELLAMNPSDLLEGEHKAIFLDRIQKMMSGQKVTGNIEYKIRMKSGEPRWALLNVNFTHRDGIPVAARVTATDVTERKRAEDALRESEERYRLALDAAALGTWRHDLATGILSLDERARSHSGFDANTVTFAQVLAIIHPDDVARVEREVTIALDPANSTGYYATEYRIVHPDGGIRWVSVQANAYFEGQGTTRQPVQVIGLSQEITERKQAEEALRAANEELRRFNNVMVGRELRMIELKKEVNELCGSTGSPRRYPLESENEAR